MRNIPGKSSGENRIKSLILSTFFKTRVIFEMMWKNMLGPDRPQHNMAHALCILDN